MDVLPKVAKSQHLTRLYSKCSWMVRP